MNPKVSIIVPIYGVERYIERCAVSLMEQTYKDIEYIFVNDATPDRSMEVLQQVLDRYPKRAPQVRILTHSQNKGISATRNTGLDAVAGDYILYVDSDDYVARETVEHLIVYAEQSRADIVLFDTMIVTTKGLRNEHVVYDSKESYIKSLLQHTAKCAHWNKFYRASFYRQTGVHADEQVRLADDYAVTPRLVHQARSIAVLPEPLYFYETTNQSSYVHNLSRTAIESQHRADQILIDYFSSIPDAEVYADVVSVLSQRSLVSLIKNADVTCWYDILDVYRDELSHSGSQMTMVNQIIFHLAKNKKMQKLRLFMRLYHLVMRCK